MRLTFFLCILGGCPRPIPPPTPGGETHPSTFPAASTPWGRHAGADLCFPTTAPVGWRFGGTRHDENPDGLDLSWSYGDESGTVLSVYAYPQHGPAPQGMSLAEAESRAAGGEVENVEWTAAGTVVPLFGGPGFLLAGIQQKLLTSLIPLEMQPEFAKMLGVPSLDGVSRAFGTLVLVWTDGPWFIKLRVTWMNVDVSADELPEQAP